MKLPHDFQLINLVPDLEPGVYPLNFAPFEEGNNGAGDYYGLYWPLGQEQQEPFICGYEHDYDSLTAEYRNLTEFLADQRATPSLGDESFFVNPYLKAKLLARKGLLHEAIAKLQVSISLFGEYAASWSLLAQLLQRNQQPGAADAGRQAMLANWSFGIPGFACFELFRKLPVPVEFTEDPLFRYRESLFELSSPSASLQVNFPELWRVIEDYKSQQDSLAATQLLRNYGYLLRRHRQSPPTLAEITEHDWLAEVATLRPLLTS